LVVTVNYRTADLAIHCLASLEPERSHFAALDAVVVDNASEDGSPERLRRALDERGWRSWARVVENSANTGFGAGNNLVLRASLAEAAPPDYFLLLNPDAAVDPGAVRTLVDFMADHPRAGFVGPLTVCRGETHATAFRFPGILNALDEGLHFGPLTRLFSRWQLAPSPRSEPHRTDWLSGGCVLIRRAVLEEVGLFDEAFFLYFEEVDLTRRAARAGWESWYVPAATILHEAGGYGRERRPEVERRMPRYWFESAGAPVKNRGRMAASSLTRLAGGNAVWNLRRWLTGAPRKEPIGF
jgi:GT2 family glycosyltransferase